MENNNYEDLKERFIELISKYLEESVDKEKPNVSTGDNVKLIANILARAYF